jgi:gliding motility-associated-like protein
MLKRKIIVALIDFSFIKKSILLFLLVVFSANKVVAQTISNVRIGGNQLGIHFCRGSVANVTFDTTGPFTGTAFRVELSDTAGVFGSPIVLNTGISTTIAITIPALPSSNNYSIRVVRISTPTVIGDTIKFITLTKPKSNFTFTNDSSCPGTPISFTNTSAPFGGSGILAYLWTLNPANLPNSNILNPIVAYPPTTGNSTTTYPARLVVTDAFGCKDTTVKNVTVRHKPKANLILDPFTTPNFSFTAPRTFSKCNSSNPNVLTVVNPDTAVYANYLIRWGDTTSNYDTSLFISAAQHSYSFNGARDLTYIVTNGNGCKDTQNIIVYIGTNPSISMPNPGNTTAVCLPRTLPRTIQFNIAGFSSNSSDTKYKIESSEGVQDSFVHPPPNVYNKNYFNSSCGFTSPNPYPNSFYLKIIASNSCGSSTQMVEPIQISRRPKADFSISPDTVVCLNNNLTFTNNSIRGVYINPASPSVCDTSDFRIWQISPATGWSLLPGSIMNGLSVTNSITVKFNTVGVYQIGYLVINNSSPCGNDTIIKTVIVNDTSRRNIFSTICRNKPIIFNGQAINTAGIYRDTLVNSKGCDSFLYLSLTVIDTTRKDSFRTICKNESVVFNGVSLNTSGVYRDTFVNSKGCDSFVYLHLIVNDVPTTVLLDTICKNQSVVFNGVSLNTSGVYRDTFVNSKGCDSFLYLILTVNDTTRKDSFRTICKNQFVVFNGVSLNTSGVYRDTFVNSKGCDSFLYLILTVNDTTRKDSFRTICKNQFVVFNGVSLNTSGVYRDTFVNATGCDSFLVLNLTVNDTTRKDSFRTICKNQSVVFNGVSLNTTGVYRDTFVNSKGCDSFLYLILTVNDTTRKDSFRTICKNQFVVFNGVSLNTSGVYRDTFVNSKGCDSFLYLILTVNDTTRKDSFRTICKNQFVVFNGVSLNTSGVYRDTFVNAAGCDSLLVLHLTVNDTTRKDSFRTICKNQFVVFNGVSLNTTGVYRDTFVNSKGCDSFLYLILTVNDTTRKDSFRTICKNQFVVFNGVSLNTSGVFRDTFVNSKGCDSFLYLILTVNDTTRKDSFRTICKNQFVVFNGVSLNTSGVYRDTFVNSKGCDSFLYLILTVNDTTRKDSFRTICKNQFVVFNGVGLNTSGVYRDTFVNSKGCDSFLYLILTVNDTTRKDSFRTICKNQFVVFNGVSLNTSGVYRDTFVNSKGCDSLLYLILTVNDTTRKDSFRTICRYQPITFNGQTLNTSGVYRDTFVNSKGCDSFLYLILTVNDTTRKDSFRTICKNQFVVFNGVSLNTSGVYRDTFVNSKGCDSFLYLILTVNDTTGKDSFRTICKNQFVVFNGVSLNTSGVYRDTFVNAAGCDSLLVLHLTVNDTTRKDSFRTICKNQFVMFNGVSLNTTGVYRDTFVNSKGCDSFLYLILTVNDTTRKDSFRTICKNQFVVFNGVSLNTSGVFRDTFVNSKGCDSFLYLILTVNDTTRKDSFRTICKNQFVVFNGVSLNTSGVYRDTFVNSKGCDSFLYLILTVNDTTRKDSFRTICKNQFVVFNGVSLNTSGVYRDTFVNAAGCDSLLVLHLTVNDTTRKDSFRTICKNQSLVFNGQTLNTSGVYRDTLVNSKGCDSFLYLILTVNDTTRKDSFRTICRYQPITFNGQTLNTSGVYRDTLVNATGCDSFLYLILTVNDTSRKDSFWSICKSQSVVFNGISLNTTGVYRDTFVNAAGCDSFLVLNLTVNDTTRKDSFRTICKNQFVVFNGVSLNTSGVYRDTFVNAAGCDSLLVLHLTVNDTTRKDSFRTICKNQFVMFNGVSLNTSGVFRDTFVNSKGCDSFLYLILTVNDTTRKDSFRTICKNQFVVFNGVSLNTSGVFRDTFVNSKGCDSFLYLILTVNDTTRKDSFRTICKNQFVVFNGVSLNTSGVYRDTFVNSKGCDSFLYLILTVNDTTRKDSFRTICKNQFVVFNGVSLNTSGVYRDTFVNAAGCDSLLVLHLTVNDTTRKDSFRTICKNQSLVFNGQTLNTSGVYRDTLVNSKGCDSFLYLILRVNDTTRKDSFRTICKNQTVKFNGISLNTSGVYRDTLVNATGCDSFLYLILTVNDTSRKDSFWSICKSQSVVFNGISLNTTGVYRDTLVNAAGCDSFLVLHLAVNDTTRIDSFRTICKNQAIIFNGQILNTSGVYRDTFLNVAGCLNFFYLHLIVNDISTTVLLDTTCKNNPKLFNGSLLNVSGLYRDTLVNSKGCDSFIFYSLFVKDTSKFDSFYTICKNQSVLFNGVSLNTSGVYRDTLVNAIGCDSFLVLNLTVNDTTKKDSFLAVCKNKNYPVIFNGVSLIASGTYKDTLTNVKGCDSFVYLHLIVNDVSTSILLDTTCKNYPKLFNGSLLNVSGLYRDTLVNSKGCDSFIFYSLYVKDTSKFDSFYTICQNQSVLFNGVSLNTSGVYRDTLVNAIGCDSFLVLHLTVNDSTKKDSFLSVCKNKNYPVIFNGVSLIQSGTYKDTLTNVKGCDSFVYLHLIVNDVSTTVLLDTTCKNYPKLFNGSLLNVSGLYRDTLVNSKGCDSFIFYSLFVKDTSKFDSFYTICKNQSVLFNGVSLNTSGVYRDTMVNAIGCDSFLVLHLTVNEATKKDSFLAICKNKNYPIIFNGQILNTSGVYQDTLVNSKGCDSFLFLILTVNDRTIYDTFLTICKNYPVIFNGVSRNFPGIYKDTMVNSQGCDSFIHLHLTVMDTTRKDSFLTIFNNRLVVFNGQTLNTSGIYRDTLVNSNGCDSFLVLTLTVNDTINALADILLPNYFSPNGDGENDNWVLPEAIYNLYPNLKVILYNRWGNIVWRSNGVYQNDWGGIHQKDNLPVPDGVYFYLIELVSESKKTISGFVEVMRQ